MKNINRYLVAAAIVGGLTTTFSARADDPSPAPTLTAPGTRTAADDERDYPLYRAQEVDVDLFGSGTIGQQTLEHVSGDRIRRRSLWGGGGGATYFFCRYIGVGGDFDADGRDHHFADDASGNIYARLPIYNTGLAPYVFGGGGYQFQDTRQCFGQAGGGLEFRFCKHVGVFVDGRYLFTERTQNYALARVGLRVSF